MPRAKQPQGQAGAEGREMLQRALCSMRQLGLGHQESTEVKKGKYLEGKKFTQIFAHGGLGNPDQSIPSWSSFPYKLME